MRHIPEDELHAYLDQGLSRSQCVEIESHLAGCPSCRANRDGIAALRDRTTALLAQLAPPRRFPPAFEALRDEAAQRLDTRRRRLRIGAWAASLIAAVGLGWTASSVIRPARPDAIATRSVPRPVEPVMNAALSDSAERRPAPSPAPSVAVNRPSAPAPAAPARPAVRDERTDSVQAAREAKLAVLDPVPALELAPLSSDRPDGGEQFDGIWRTVSWDGARSETGEDVPHIDGLPVLRVQVQANDRSKRPLMVVAQQLTSGQVIQTIEGPASDVSQLLARRTTTTSADGSLSVSVSGAEPAGDQAMAMQVGDRMLAITGALPSDSLRAMIRRMNAEMRSK